MLKYMIKHDMQYGSTGYRIIWVRFRGDLYVGELLAPDGLHTGYSHSAKSLTDLVAYLEAHIESRLELN